MKMGHDTTLQDASWLHRDDEFDVHYCAAEPFLLTRAFLRPARQIVSGAIICLLTACANAGQSRRRLVQEVVAIKPRLSSGLTARPKQLHAALAFARSAFAHDGQTFSPHDVKINAVHGMDQSFRMEGSITYPLREWGIQMPQGL